MTALPADPIGAGVRLEWGEATTPGAVREQNEDTVFASPPLFVVCDGMGGHDAGKEASQAVVDAFEQTVTGPWMSSRDVVQALASGNRDVGALGAASKNPPGTTVAGVGVAWHDGGPCWLVFNIGDSRVYRLDGHGLEQISVDHSLAQQMREQGLPGAERAGHLITRAVGAGAEAAVADQWLLPMATGERMLLCSDGLSDELTDQLIQAILSSYPSPADAASALVDAAVGAGGRDNVSVVVVDAVEVPGVAAAPDAASADTVDGPAWEVTSDPEGHHEGRAGDDD